MSKSPVYCSRPHSEGPYSSAEEHIKLSVRGVGAHLRVSAVRVRRRLMSVELAVILGKWAGTAQAKKKATPKEMTCNGGEGCAHHDVRMRCQNCMRIMLVSF